jgi:hypothetical protein
MKEKREIPKVRYMYLKKFNKPKLFRCIKWWSDQTKLNVHTLSLEPAEIINNTIFAVFAFIGNKIVGAAGIMQLPGQMDVYLHGHQVVEFRANCVDSNFEKFGIGTALHKARIDYVDQHELHAVMITKESTILRMSKKFGWVHIYRIKGTEHVVTKIRKCKCQPHPDKPFKGLRCETCPFFEKSIFIRLYQRAA